GILAFDPTSPFSGGALLGDRIRMQSVSADEGVYIRSMATRGHLGGLALAAQDAVTVLEAAGYEMILVETVGVGQDEVEVAGLADVTLLLLVPGMGDAVQTFKAGVMEIADVFVINKADHGGADCLEREIAAMMGLAPRTDGWRPPILKTIATTGEGVEDVRQALENFRSYGEQNSLAQRREREKWRARILAMVRQSLLDGIAGPQLRGRRIESHVEEIMERRRDPHSVVEELIRDFKAGLG
ncbi:MAG TPA: methylmalonyl Co-A mutase-associated GTPase MeaB, partial [Terriglobia bacterium]|nr:methylmalonyl Co-A mutase-associated GTPase MeaB [Terriglobia bacterium]